MPPISATIKVIATIPALLLLNPWAIYKAVANDPNTTVIAVAAATTLSIGIKANTINEPHNIAIAVVIVTHTDNLAIPEAAFIAAANDSKTTPTVIAPVNAFPKGNKASITIEGTNKFTATAIAIIDAAFFTERLAILEAIANSVIRYIMAIPPFIIVAGFIFERSINAGINKSIANAMPAKESPPITIERIAFPANTNIVIRRVIIPSPLAIDVDFILANDFIA